MMWLAGAAASTLSGGGVDLEWTIREGVLEGTASAATSGWVCVGFNGRVGLAGSTLILGAMRGEVGIVEEHVARPPRHPKVQDVGMAPGLLKSSVEQRDGRTIVHFTWRLRDGLVAGGPVHLTLAWSRDSDFDHHSAQRVQIDGTL